MRLIKFAFAIIAGTMLVGAGANAAEHTSTRFAGPKVNGGTVTHSVENGKDVLALSTDFKAPETPDPHWAVIDSRGERHLLDKLMTKDKKLKGRIELPSHVHDVAKVEIWCAYAEVVLGEAAFDKPIASAR